MAPAWQSGSWGCPTELLTHPVALPGVSCEQRTGSFQRGVQAVACRAEGLPPSKV